MAVSAQRITLRNAPSVAGELTSFLTDGEQRKGLHNTRPDVCGRYPNRARATLALGKVAAARTMETYVLRQADGSLFGLGTVIRHMRIYDPATSGELIGHLIDYWIGAGSDLQTHVAATEEMLHQADTDSPLAILSDREKMGSLGIPELMQERGEPGSVQAPEGVGDYGLPKIQDPLQVYWGLKNLVA